MVSWKRSRSWSTTKSKLKEQARLLLVKHAPVNEERDDIDSLGTPSRPCALALGTDGFFHDGEAHQFFPPVFTAWLSQETPMEDQTQLPEIVHANGLCCYCQRPVEQLTCVRARFEGVSLSQKNTNQQIIIRAYLSAQYIVETGHRGCHTCFLLTSAVLEHRCGDAQLTAETRIGNDLYAISLHWTKRGVINNGQRQKRPMLAFTASEQQIRTWNTRVTHCLVVGIS